MVLHILAIIQSSRWRETDVFGFFTALASEARGEKTLSLGAEEGVIITG